MRAARMLLSVGVVAAVLAASAPPLAPVGEADAVVAGVVVGLQTVQTGLSRPILATHAGDGSGRLFIVEQTGAVKVLQGGVLSTYLNIASKVSCCGERGLLGLAFDPNFASNGRLYVSYTGTSPVGVSVLERYTVASPATGLPNPAAGTVLLTQTQPFSNHNGGHIAFGPDGYLYWGIGDGGSAGDPQNNAQNLGTLLGKMLRLDVGGAGAAPAPGNPFVGVAGAKPEIWAYGLRNPWRFSFDRATGDLWIGDVGQNLIEEVDVQAAGSAGGQNYGWRPWEGHNPYNPTQALSTPGTTFPVLEYTHAEGCSITGGHVYRGPGLAFLQGRYVFGDYCQGTVWATTTVAGTLQKDIILQATFDISSFGEDEAGNLHVVAYHSTNGAVYRLVDP